MRGDRCDLRKYFLGHQAYAWPQRRCGRKIYACIVACCMLLLKPILASGPFGGA